MRIHRGSLFWGIFFLLLGGLPLAQREGLLDITRIGEVGRLWPLAIIAVGIAILVSRTRLALLGTVLLGVILGGLAGGAIAGGNGFVLNFGDCGAGSPADMSHLTRTGALAAGSIVDLTFSCGTLDVATRSGDGWNLDAGYQGGAPIIDAGATRLGLQTPTDGSRRQEWSLTVPRDQLGTMAVRVNAGSAKVDVGGAKLSRLTVDGNAGDVRITAVSATIDRLDLSMNAGSTKVILGGSADGAIRVNAGSVDVCVPPDAAVRITVQEQLTFAVSLDRSGLTRSGNVWQRAGTSGTTIRLDVSGSAASFHLDPTGGCK